MDIKQVEYFLAIVSRGSFSSAADDLFISQSSLSKQILALEKELEVQLFDRSKRKISLTEAGEIFQKRALELNAMHKTMLIELEGFKGKPNEFSIVSIPVMAQYGITSAIAQFKQIFPHINFLLKEQEGMTILPSLQAREYDIGFIRDNYVNRELFTCVNFCDDCLEVMVSSRHKYADRAKIALSELKNDNFVMFDQITILHKLTIESCEKTGFKPRMFYASTRVESIIGLVAANIGLGLIPKRIFDYYRPPDVVAIPLEDPIQSDIAIVHLKNIKLPPAAQTFIDSMKNINHTDG
jgi:LysR family transcriptional activator of glutamate synthase operon